MSASKEDLRLGFHYHAWGLLQDGKILLPGFLGRFVDSLADHCRELTCFFHSPMPEERNILDYPLHAHNVRLVDLGPHDSVPRRMLRSASVIRTIRAHRHNLDAMLIRGPSPLLPQVASACRDLPLILMLVADYLAGIENLSGPAWRRQLIHLWAIWNTNAQKKVVKRSLTFVNSHALFEQFKPLSQNLIELRTTTLNEEDFCLRKDTCQSSPIRILYTGRMATSKGILDILTAVHLLVQEGFDLQFDLVGMPEPGDNLLQELPRLTQEMGLEDRVKYHGYKSVGPDLFRFYQQADLFVVASRASFEGFPRTIWEAMAHCLPVVATRVSSIPLYIEGAADLVEPNHPLQIAASLRRLIQSPEIRKQYIKKGLELARANTMPAQMLTMLSRMNDWMKEKQ